ncbi:MAG: NlpC/P60 family protein [Verrucomicrobiales bacterium]|nr:NlpC/P60 family protein [Verrucomicrobiales bacterium]
MTPRLLIILLIGSVAGICEAFFNPVNNFHLRVLLIAGIAGAFFTLFFLAGKSAFRKIALLFILLLTLIPFLLPSREINSNDVREDYLNRLIQLNDVPYHWGGESAGGIDCSGLPRKTLREAMFWHGVKTGNGKPIRAAVSQWWNDASAKAISEGYRDYATKLGTEGSIAKMSYAELKPGDLAVSMGGVHVLVYLGNDQWIQAAPEVGHVAIFDGRKDNNRWLKVAVTTHRWKVFE